MDLSECLAKGLLKKDVPNMEKGMKSIQISRYKIDIAKKLQHFGISDQAVVNAYASMFHAARALLFRDGFVEKSHYALFVFLSEKYQGVLERRFFVEFNRLRLDRHEINYGLEIMRVDRDEANRVVKIVTDFIGAVEMILKKK